MKSKFTLLFALLMMIPSVILAQKKEKIKGSKIVTIVEKDIPAFTSIEVKDNLEVFLVKGTKNNILIETDDNIQEAILFDVQNGLLQLKTSKEIQSSKKLYIKISYSEALNLVIAKDESVVSAIQEMVLDQITFQSFDKAKLMLNANIKNFSLKADDKSKIELNLKSENCKLELSKNSSLKALVNAMNVKCDLYQKSEATIEGDATNSTIRLDNSTELTANKLSVKNMELIIENDATCSILAENNLNLSAIDQTKVELYGSPKIEIKKFDGESKLHKKLPLKK